MTPDMIAGLILGGVKLIGQFANAAATIVEMNDMIGQLETAAVNLETEMTTRFGDWRGAGKPDETDGQLGTRLKHAREDREAAEADILAERKAELGADATTESGVGSGTDTTTSRHALALAVIQQRRDDITTARNLALYGTETEGTEEGATAGFYFERNQLRAQHLRDEATYTRKLQELAAHYGVDINGTPLADPPASSVLGQLALQLKYLDDNQAALIAEIDAKHQQLIDSRDRTLLGLQVRAADGDAEAKRELDDIAENLASFTKQTKDKAILDLNEAAAQGVYSVGRAEEQAVQATGEAVAKSAGSGLRRSGSPLMTMRQMERDAKEAARREEERQAYQMASMQGEVANSIGDARLKAGQSSDQVAAQLVMLHHGLDQQIAETNLAFSQADQNNEFTRQDAERKHTQDETLLKAQIEAAKAEASSQIANVNDSSAQMETDFALREAGLNQSINTALATYTSGIASNDLDVLGENQRSAAIIRDLDSRLAAAGRQETHARDLIIGDATLMVTELINRKAETTHRKDVLANPLNQALVFTGIAAGALGDVLSATRDLLSKGTSTTLNWKTDLDYGLSGLDRQQS